MGVPSDVDWHIGANLVRQAAMVHVRMGEQHTQEAIVGIAEPRHVGEKPVVVAVGRVETEAEIKNDATSIGLHLDAGAADFFRTAMDANFHLETVK